MSETTATPSTPADGFFLDGDAPRLGSSPMIPPAPLGSSPAQTAPPQPAAVPDLPLASPVLTAPAAAPPASPVAPALPPTAPDLTAAPDLAQTPALPSMPAVVAPSLPTATPQTPAADVAAGTDDHHEGASGEHPMAHLMPSKPKPSAATTRAAEIRAVRKAKTKKIKIGVAAGALIVSALAGPPLLSWLTNAINEAGNLTTDEPAP